MKEKKIEFGSWESIALLINLVFAQVMLIFPKEMVQFGGSAAWMISTVIVLLALIYFSILSNLCNRMENMDLLDICDASGGRPLKVVFGMIFTAFLTFVLAILLGGFAETLKITSLDSSPLEFVEVLFLLGMLASAYFGIESVARINAFLVPLVIIVYSLITLGTIPEFDINHLFPVLGEGYASLSRGSILKLSTYASFFIVICFMPPFFKKRNFKRIGYTTILISGLLLLWSTLSFLLVFPYEIAVNKKIPVFQLARHVEVGNYIQRIESLFVLICAVCALLSLSVLFSFIIYIFSKTLDLEKYRPMVFPMGIIIYSLGLIFKRMHVELIDNAAVNISWLAGMLLPLLVVMIGLAKKAGHKEREELQRENKDQD